MDGDGLSFSWEEQSRDRDDGNDGKMTNTQGAASRIRNPQCTAVFAAATELTPARKEIGPGGGKDSPLRLQPMWTNERDG